MDTLKLQIVIFTETFLFLILENTCNCKVIHPSQQCFTHLKTFPALNDPKHPTVLPAKSDSDIMFAYKVIRDLLKIDISLVY